MKKIALLGSTGSIGTQVLNVVRRNAEKFEIVSLCAHANSGALMRQIKEFKPRVACLARPDADFYGELKKLSFAVDFYEGEEAYLSGIIAEADIVVVALVGFIGLKAVLKALEAGKDVALANKESLVVGGDAVFKAAKKNGAQITPIDSEHSAIWQALGFDFSAPFEKLILTASGGAFRDLSLEQLKNVKAADALKHPTWNMGAKITVDCATLVNKGLEVIEAKWLYSAPFERIQAVMHRESIIHSMVQYGDGSVIAQMSYPTMEIPIQLALNYPERLKFDFPRLDFAKIGKLHFGELDSERFPCFDLTVSAGKSGGLYPSVMNAANEIAVSLFLNDKIGFYGIYRCIEKTLSAFKDNAEPTFAALERADGWARAYAFSLFEKGKI